MAVHPHPRGEQEGRLDQLGHDVGSSPRTRGTGEYAAISQVALDMLLDGDKDSLDAYLSGDRSSERVRSYYARRSIPLQIDPAGSADYADTSGGRM